jgi:MerR family transcriptional regulator/heat shock protein HspR
VISVASRLLALHPQTLRKYERAGFVVPSRTEGNLRLYSPEDLNLLRQVKYLVDERGVNLAGVELALLVTHMAERLLEAAQKEPNATKLRQSVQETATQMLRTLGVMSNEQ